ncbi:hypothetical protein EPN81_03985 [Patescibacteria group bacterium]|nr:MAG: hypothetical protein EPN81_03985 [Patescibacteria group bacterium]
MWRFESSHKRAESHYLDHVIARIEVDPHLFRHAESLLDAVGHQEPLIAQSYKTPQDIRYHAEGPFMRDHLRSMLMFLFALSEEKVHLIDIEEFRRMKGYEGEIQELEDIIKENILFFQVFIFGHDVAKWLSVTFSSKSGSRGSQLRFNTPREHQFDEAAHERVKKLAEYLDLYEHFAHQEFQGTDRETQAQFFLQYGIQVHYPHHARKISAPVFSALLTRLCHAHRLPDRDRAMLEDLIAHHMEFGSDFRVVNPTRIRRYTHMAFKRGYDADDFIDLVQACLLLDHCVGSLRLRAHGYWHESTSLVNFFQSEHDFAPRRRVEKEAEREAREKNERNQVLRDVGLDGVAMMDVLGMESGPEFGLALRRIHAGLLGQAKMPSFGRKIDAEIERRAGAFYKKMFVKGE